MCHISELSEKLVKDVKALHAVGDRAQAVIIGLDEESFRIKLSMKPSSFPGQFATS